MENKQLKVQPNYKKQARDQMEGKLQIPIIFTLVYGTITAMFFALIHFIFNINLSQSFLFKYKRKIL